MGQAHARHGPLRRDAAPPLRARLPSPEAQRAPRPLAPRYHAVPPAAEARRSAELALASAEATSQIAPIRFAGASRSVPLRPRGAEVPAAPRDTAVESFGHKLVAAGALVASERRPLAVAPLSLSVLPRRAP